MATWALVYFFCMCRVFVSPDVAFAGEPTIAQVTHPTFLLFPDPSLLRLLYSMVHASWPGAFNLRTMCREFYGPRAPPSCLAVGLTSSVGGRDKWQLNITLNWGRQWCGHCDVANRWSAVRRNTEIVRRTWSSVRRKVKDRMRISGVGVEKQTKLVLFNSQPSA
jgi:hypothetical protein